MFPSSGSLAVAEKCTVNGAAPSRASAEASTTGGTLDSPTVMVFEDVVVNPSLSVALKTVLYVPGARKMKEVFEPVVENQSKTPSPS